MQEKAHGLQFASSSPLFLRERLRKAWAHPIRWLWQSPWWLAHWAPWSRDIAAEHSAPPPGLAAAKRCTLSHPRDENGREESAEFTSQISLGVAPLADGGSAVSVPYPRHRLDHARH